MIDNKTVVCCEQIDESICKKCCEIDQVEASSTNLFQLSLMLNTWAMVGEDLGWIDWYTSIQGLVSTKGLVGTISICKRVFYAVIDAAQTSPDGCGEMFSDALSFVKRWEVSTFAQAHGIKDGYQALSWLFRFPLRFTYKTDAPATSAFEKFLEANRECYSSSDNRRKLPVKAEGAFDSNDPDQMPIIEGYKPFLATAWKGFDRFSVCQKLVPIYNQQYHMVRNPYDMEGGAIKRPGYSLILSVKRYIEDMLGTAPVADFRYFRGGFSSGSNARDVGLVKFKGKFTLARKLQELYEYDARFDHMDYGYFLPNNSNQKASSRVHYLIAEQRGVAMIAVPKTLTDRRLIKPEPVCRAHYAMRVRKMLEACILSTDHYKYINWSDQNVNKHFAYLGSIGCGYSTIDASAASDRISREIALMLLPEWVRPYIINAISDYVIVDNKRVRVRCLSTSGNQITWLTLAIIMWAIAEYGCSWYLDDDGNPMHASAYGDDLIVPDCAYETVVDLLETFGFKINKDKSYSSGSAFRESCGGDYINGTDITPMYWRRGIVDINNFPDTISFVCTLQHKFFNLRRTRSYLERVARRLDPKITYSCDSSDCSDLWAGNMEYLESEMVPHRKLISHQEPVEDIPQAVMDHQYFKFLRDGRMYASDSDRFFDISMSYLDPSIFREPTMRWVTVRPSYLLDKK